MFHVLQISTGYTNGTVEKGLIEAAGGSYSLISSEAEDDIIAAGQTASGLLVALTTVSERVINALPGLRLIVRAGIGVDNIDLNAAKARGVRVCNLPHYCQDEVADHTAAMLLALERKLLPKTLDIRSGAWNPVKAYMPIRGLPDAVVGFVGCGGIAQRVMARMKPFGVTCIGYDPYFPAEKAAELGLELVCLDSLLRRSDFVSLHVPLTDSTRGILDGEAFAKMKPGACVVNTARGPLIDNDALFEALRSGRLAGAALDVIEGDIEGARRFADFDNVIITPHTAYYSERSNVNIKKQAGETFARFIKGEPLDNYII